MKKVFLLEVKQKDKSFFMGVLDPRKVVKLIDIPAKNTNQETNRPWKEKRVEEIADYVAGKKNISDKKDAVQMANGYIPNCPILSLAHPFQIYKENGMSYIEFPEMEEEIEKYYGSITVLDGQHRLISFDDHYIDPTVVDFEYNMGFILFTDLTINEKREIFMITNDMQEKVESNVLKLMKRWLGLLTEKEDYLYKITERLNQEDISALRGKIIIGGNKISGGFKAAQIIKMLDKSGIYDKISNKSEEEQIKILCTYFNAWKEVYSGKFLNSKHFMGKTTGLRYVCFLFPVIGDILWKLKKGYTKENIKDILSVLRSITIDNEKVYEDMRYVVRSESGTISIARSHGEELKNNLLNNEEQFNIFDAI